MQLRKYRWSKDYESAEEELVRLLNTRRIISRRWVGEEFETHEPVTAEGDMTLWCAEGMLNVTAAGKQFSLQPGDALDVPAGAGYQVSVRMGGCVCYES